MTRKNVYVHPERKAWGEAYVTMRSYRLGYRPELVLDRRCPRDRVFIMDPPQFEERLTEVAA